MLSIFNKIRFLKDPLDKIIEQDEDPINQARIRMIVYSILLSLLLVFILIPVYILNGPSLQLIRVIIILVALLGILKFLAAKPVWKEASHGLEAILTFLIWSNIFIFIHGVNIITLQYAFLVVIFGFYVLGVFWGIFYSAINVMPIILFIILNGQDNIQNLVSPQQVGNTVFYLILCYNFFLIVFAHYHFFQAFQTTIRQLNIAGNNQKLLNERLTETMQEAEASSQAKLDFLSTMSHELRTPLNGVIGMTNLLLLENPRNDQEENLNILKFSAESLLTLVNDILDFNKIGLDKLDIESVNFNLAELIQNSCASLNVKAQEKGLDFKLNIDRRLPGKIVTGDPTRLAQILFNLVSNAIKFTHKGSVVVSVNLLDVTDEAINIHFSVADTGIGIPDDKKAIIFEPFMQASKNTTRKFGGTGLGLAIVKLLLELQNSRINLISVPDEGTEFFFDMGFGYSSKENSHLKENNKNKKQTDFSNLHVLIVEDNQINILFMKKLFSNWNIDPVVAENGEEAIRIFEKQDFDVILMDIHMPVMDGYEATAHIRKMQDKKKAGVHIIAVTASVSHNARVSVREAGIDDYIQKPFQLEELREKLEKIYYDKITQA